ncbi:MAG: transposase [Pirellulaceae bacterium]
MSDRRRHFEEGYCYHVVNRGTQRRRLFFSDADYADFEGLMFETLDRLQLPTFTYELMPNHWHFVVRPYDKQQLSEYFQFLAGTHAKRFHAALGTIGEGHVYQDRFKSFPVQNDGHFLALCRYVERNALQAKLVVRAEDWRWSGLWRRLHGCDDQLISAWPVARPDDWLHRVNQPLLDAEVAAIALSIRRGTPLGSPEWISETAERLDLRHTMRPKGRPPLVRNIGGS